MTTDHPEKVSQAVEHLRASRDVHLEIQMAAIQADAGNVYVEDLLVMAALQRSIALLEGFAVLVYANNPPCALPLIRFQLDSAMRLAACELAAPSDVHEALMADTPLGRVKGHDGRALTDRRLHEHLSLRFPWVSKLYKCVCGHIHFSSPHLLAPVASFPGDRVMTLEMGNPAGPRWVSVHWLEAIEAMRLTTDLLLQVCGSWVTHKKVRSKRGSIESDQPDRDGGT